MFQRLSRLSVPWLATLPPRRRRLVVWSVGLLLFYTLAGFLLLPPIVRVVAAKQLSKQLNRHVSIAKLKLNPYTLSATVRGFLIQDKDGQPFIAWDEVYANFQFFSLFTRTFVFKEVRTSQPSIRVQVNADRTLNFSDILEKVAQEAAAQPKKAPSKTPRGLRVDRLHIAGARLSATDLTTKRPFTKLVGPLELTLQNFATHPDNKNPYSFSGTTADGEKFSWSGHFFLDPIRSVGEFALENISLTRYAPLYQELTRFEIQEGSVDVRSAYHVQHAALTNVARLTNASVTVRSLKLVADGQTQPTIEVPEFSIAGASIDAFERVARVDSIRTRGGRLAVRRNADASINLVELAKPEPGATNAAGSVQLLQQALTNVVALLLRSTNAWNATLDDFQVDDYAIQIDDQALPRAMRLHLDQIQARLRNLSNRPGSEFTAQAQMRWNTNGQIRTEATVSLLPLQAQVKLSLNDLEIQAFDSYVDPFLNLRVKHGRVGMEGEARLITHPTNATPNASFHGDLWVQDFSTVDGLFTEDFVQWKDLRVSGLEAKLDPLGATVREVSLRDARARLVIDSEKTNNVFTVLRRNVQLAAAPGAAGTDPPNPPKQGRSRLRLQIPTNLITSAQATLPRLSLETLTLTNLHVDYVDRSLQPGVTLSIDELGGSIAGISTEDLSRADLRLTGTVGKSAPMEVTGKLNLLSQKDYTDVKVSFKGIELLPTSPYAGKFLGYRLNRGKLSLDVHYQLADGKLKGQNVVILDQLTLGERVDSPDALKLPIKLALAILKDRSGRIDLDVPVEGSLADPEFRLGKVITRALLNVITKIVTSPFAALGGLFGGKGEEVSYQDFAPGSNELPPANKEKLDVLVKGLFERPGLQLEIEAATDPVTDRPALARLKLQKQFRAQKWAALRKSERERQAPEQLELAPEEYDRLLKEAHARLFSAEAMAARAREATPTAANPTNPVVKAATPSVARTAISDGTAKGATALLGDRTALRSSTPDNPQAAQDLEAQVLDTVEVTEGDFAMLAAERARRVKEYILQSRQIEPERVLVAEKPDDTNPAKGSRVVLHLR